MMFNPVQPKLELNASPFNSVQLNGYRAGVERESRNATGIRELLREAWG